MKFITCASYHGTGSSAITDLISEFNNVLSFTNEEFRFLHDIDGVADLEYHLVENHNRHNSGHALKRYKRLVDFYSGNSLLKRYEAYFNNQWRKISYEYIADLTDFTYKGWWQYDLLDKGAFYYYLKLLPGKFIKATLWRNKSEKVYNALPNEITYCSYPTKEEFIELTRNYIEKLFNVVNKDNKEFIMVDQIVAASNIKKYTKYFENIKVVLVDRDPRDMYLLAKYEWNDPVIPTETIELFCKWYKYTRKHRKTEKFDSETVKFIMFEDLIYRYDDIVPQILDFLCLSTTDHIYKKKIFDPNVSVKNTQLWKKYPQTSKEMTYIENELKEYLYNYKNIR